MVYTRTHHRAHQWCDLPVLDREALHGNIQGDGIRFCLELYRLVYSTVLCILLCYLLEGAIAIIIVVLHNDR